MTAETENPMRLAGLVGIAGIVILATDCGGNSPTRPSEPPATRVEVAGPVALLTVASTSYK